MSNHWLHWSIHYLINHICLPWRSTSILAAHSPCTFGGPLLCVFVNGSFNSRCMLSLLLIRVFLVAISFSFNLWILVCIKHIDSFLIVEMVYFLQNDLSSYWSDLIINSLRIQFAFNLGFVMSLLLKDRLVDVVIAIYFVIGLVLALDWAGMRTSVEAGTGLTVDCGGGQGSELVITSSRFFACCSLIHLSVLKIKSWISGVVGVGECVITFSRDFGWGELVANLTCCGSWHLVPPNIWQDSLNCRSSVVWSLASLALAWMLLSVLMSAFTLLSWLIVLSLHHCPFLVYVGQKTLVLIWRCPLL